MEADVVGFDGDEAALGLVEAGGDFERRGLVLQHQAAEVAEGQAGVEDVFDEDDVLAFDGVVDVLDELDGAGGDAGAAVAGDGDEVEGVVDRDGAGEVGEEDGGAFEDADQHDGLAGVVGGDLLADRRTRSAISDWLKRTSMVAAGGKVRAGVAVGLVGMGIRVARFPRRVGSGRLEQSQGVGTGALVLCWTVRREAGRAYTLEAYVPVHHDWIVSPGHVWAVSLAGGGGRRGVCCTVTLGGAGWTRMR